MLSLPRIPHGLMFALLTLCWQPTIARANPAVPASFNVRNFGARGDGTADDTPAIRAAFAAAAKTTISIPTPGTAHHYSQNNVYFPNGRYRLTETLMPTANMVGEGNVILQQSDTEKDIVSSKSVWRWRIHGFTFLGGRHHLHIGNANRDSGRIIIDNCNFYNAAGTAIRIRKGSNSTQATITNCTVLNCDQVLVNWCDMTKFADTWVTTARTMKNKAAIENHGILLIEHMLGVPLVQAENDQRWIDNHGGLTCRNVRFGGEFAGMTIVVNWARYDATYPVIPISVVIDNCHVYALGNPARKSMVYCEEIPNQIIVTNNNGLPDLPMVAVSDKLDLDTYFDDALKRDPQTLKFSIGPEQVEVLFRNAQLPEQMRPFQTNQVWGNAPPTTGNWQRGTLIRKREPKGSVAATTAGGELFGWYCVGSGTPGSWQPVRLNFPEAQAKTP